MSMMSEERVEDLLKLVHSQIRAFIEADGALLSTMTIRLIFGRTVKCWQLHVRTQPQDAWLILLRADQRFTYYNPMTGRKRRLGNYRLRRDRALMEQILTALDLRRATTVSLEQE